MQKKFRIFFSEHTFEAENFASLFFELTHEVQHLTEHKYYPPHLTDRKSFLHSIAAIAQPQELFFPSIAHLKCEEKKFQKFSDKFFITNCRALLLPKWK